MSTACDIRSPRMPWPALRAEESPRERSLRVRGVAGDELRAVLAHPAERSRRDQPCGVLDGRRLAVVETDDRAHACGFCGRGDVGGLGRGTPDGLLAPEVLAGRGACGECDLTVEAVRCGDADRLDLRVGDHVTPIGRPPLVAEFLDGRARSRFGLVGGDHEPAPRRHMRGSVRDTRRYAELCTRPIQPTPTRPMPTVRATRGAYSPGSPAHAGTAGHLEL